MESADFIKEHMDHLLSSGYQIENGVIQSPGKFEGNMYYALYFYVEYLETGSGDYDWFEGETLITRFNLTKSEKKAFPELADYDIFEFYEDDSGFIHGAAG
jgi:hypothetical protein